MSIRCLAALQNQQGTYRPLQGKLSLDLRLFISYHLIILRVRLFTLFWLLVSFSSFIYIHGLQIPIYFLFLSVFL